MDSKERVKYFFEHVNMEEFAEYVSEDCTVRAGEQVIPVGLAGMKQHFLAVRTTYPDLKMTVIRQYCEGDIVVSEFIAQGTHLGEWLGMKPTGKKLSFLGVNVNKVVDGKITEHSGSMNTFETLFEAGIIQPAEAC